MSPTIQNVARVGAPDFRYQTLTSQEVKARIQLFANDQVERSRSVTVAGGEQLTLPTVEPSQRAALVAAFKNASPEQQAGMAEAGNQLYQSVLAASSAGMTTEAPPEVQDAMTHAFEQYMTNGVENTVEAATSGAIYMALGSAETDLLQIAENLQANIAEKKKIRDALTLAKEERADFKDQLADVQGDGPWGFEIPDENGDYIVVSMDREQADEHLANLDKKINQLDNDYQTASDLTPMIQLQVQEAQQKYMQAMQMLSNLTKSFHDIAKAIIANLKA